jgi:HAD superfamily hydrolase (TIGR01549 family)
VALPLLALVKDCAELYIWTSNDEKTVAPILNELNINKLFKKIITRNNVNYIKPNPEGFYLINKENNSKANYLLVGDSDADKGAAIESGIDFFNIKELRL